MHDTEATTQAQQDAIELLLWSHGRRVKNEADCRVFEAAHPGRRYFRSDEVDTKTLANGRPIFNGCTTVWLKELYGPGVGHEMGVGWYLELDQLTKTTTTRS